MSSRAPACWLDRLSAYWQRHRDAIGVIIEETLSCYRQTNMGRKDKPLNPAAKDTLSALPAANGGLRLNFRQAPLQEVLNFFHDAADLTIEVEPNVEIKRPIDLSRDNPVTREEALKLLETALAREGYLAIDRIGILAIVKREDAKKHAIPLPTLRCPELGT